MRAALLALGLLLLPTVGAFPLAPSDPALGRAVGWFARLAQEDGCIPARGSGSCGFATTRDALLGLSAVGVDPDLPLRSGAPAPGEYLVAHVGAVEDEPAGCPVCKWARTAVAAAAVGRDPRAFGGWDLVSKVDAYYDGVQVGSPGQINDDLWALFAYRGAGVPANDSKLQNILRFVEARQNVDGGWSWNLAPTSDAWTTATAILAERALGRASSDLAVGRAFDFLHREQSDSGLMPQDGAASAESTALAIQAAASAGQDPDGPEWTRAGHSLLGALLDLQQADGSFVHNAQGGSVFLATTQALPALRGVPYPYRPPSLAVHADSSASDVGQLVAFRCDAIDPDGRIAWLEWDWGDGSRDSSAKASHAYATAGEFTPTCSISDDTGVPRAKSVRVRIGPEDGPALEPSDPTGSGGSDAANTASLVPPPRGLPAASIWMALLGAVLLLRRRTTN